MDNLKKGKQLANNIYSIADRSSDRLLIGKTFWKGLAMPVFLYGTEVIVYTENDVRQLQTIDNQVFRAILRTPKYTANCGLRSEVGASSTKARDMKNKLLFTKHALDEHSNELLTAIFEEQYQNNNTPWIKQVKKYLNELNLGIQDLQYMTQTQIKEKVNLWDTEVWTAEMEHKTTLTIYRQYKLNFNESSWFDNRGASVLMLRARLNTLNLNWRKEHTGGHSNCPCCDSEIETLEHFLLFCASYSEVRQKFPL